MEQVRSKGLHDGFSRIEELYEIKYHCACF